MRRCMQVKWLGVLTNRMTPATMDTRWSPRWYSWSDLINEQLVRTHTVKRARIHLHSLVNQA
jgi:hypothetical protein